MFNKFTRFISNKMSNNGIKVSLKNGLHVIQFNNPKKKNAISHETFIAITKELRNAASNPQVKATVLTGNGEYYTSGFLMINPNVNEDIEGFIKERVDAVKEFIKTFIDYPKLLMAVVNGPALGIGVTTLALCDVVYASDKASFKTPFVQIGLCAEACSSYTFPKIFGNSLANEMLLMGKEISAKEALQKGFISEVFKHEEMNQIWKKIEAILQLSPNTVMVNKNLIKKHEKDLLHQINDQEMELLYERFFSEEFFTNMMNFMNKNKKSKL